MLAIHVPEAYGGAGADKIASLHPGGGGRPGLRVVLADPDGQQARHDGAHPVGQPRSSSSATCRRLPAARRLFSYALSEREAGSDAASMKTRAVLDGDSYVLNGTKAWITGAGVSTHYTLMAVTDPTKGANGISAFVVHSRRPRLLGRHQGAQDGHQGLAHLRDLLRGLPDPGGPDDRRARHRLQDGAEDPRPHPARASARRPSASRRARWTRPSPTSRSASSSTSGSPTSRASSSWSPTWR